MQSIFDLKTDIPFDTDVFERMKKRASDMLCNIEKEQYTQAIVLLSSKGNEYAITVKNALSKEKPQENELIESLKKNSDTEINYVLCLWEDLCIDIPSYYFRKALYELDPKNTEARIFVMTKSGVSIIKSGITMK